jgi:hypothetical protein
LKVQKIEKYKSLKVQKIEKYKRLKSTKEDIILTKEKEAKDLK